jgi:anti-anti-sigma factor
MVRTTFEQRGAHATLVVEGRLGSAGARELATALEPLQQSGQPFALDLSGINYLSSPGLAVLSTCLEHAAASGTAVRVVAVSFEVETAFRLSGLELPRPEPPA